MELNPRLVSLAPIPTCAHVGRDMRSQQRYLLLLLPCTLQKKIGVFVEVVGLELQVNMG